MDPSTTLVTFLLETQPSVHSVQLIGSWDNFSSHYTMERDIRRGRGQWRGCHSFRDIVPDGSSGVRGHKRRGGLKMGHTYYYYYEVDGSTEIHDPAVPSTTACPYLPGQTVNTMNVPTERNLRKRSASLSSMRQFNFRTMNPEAKFITPRPAPPTPSISDTTNLTSLRQASASTVPHQHSSSMSLSSRSSSPAPVWRRIFTRKLSTRDIGRAALQDQDSYDVQSLGSSQPCEDARSRSLTPSEGIRTRDMSPESLRRFLSDDMPARPDSNMSERPALVIPDDIAEENEDDDNFATSAASESQPYSTCLSPPPFKRSASSETIPSVANSSSHTVIPSYIVSQPAPAIVEAAEPPAASDLPQLETNSDPASFFSNSSSAVTSPVSPQSTEAELELTSFYDATDDDDVLSNTDDEVTPYQTLSAMPSRPQDFEGYSLPREREDAKTAMSDAQPTFTTMGSPQLHVSIPASESNFLGSHVDTGLDDFVNELGWMVETIGTRAN